MSPAENTVPSCTTATIRTKVILGTQNSPEYYFQSVERGHSVVNRTHHLKLISDVTSLFVRHQDNRPFSKQTVWLVIVGKAQVLLLTITMAQLYSSIAGSHDRVTMSNTLKVKPLNNNNTNNNDNSDYHYHNYHNWMILLSDLDSQSIFFFLNFGQYLSCRQDDRRKCWLIVLPHKRSTGLSEQAHMLFNLWEPWVCISHELRNQRVRLCRIVEHLLPCQTFSHRTLCG